ncbi:MAG: hypothetical protein ACKOWF_09055 [Chloroflexota bacterium]
MTDAAAPDSGSPRSHRSGLSRRAALRRGLALAAAMAGAVPGRLPAVAGPTHLIIDLGPGGEGGDWSTATAVNGAGQVAWTWATAIDADRGVIDNIHPCLWEQGAARDLSALGLLDINGLAEDGSVLGSDGPRALLVAPGAAAAEPLPGFEGDAFATAISPGGLIAWVISGLPVSLRGRDLLPLPLPEGFGFFLPSSVNDRGTLAVIVLPPAPGAENGSAAAINAAGLVVGGSASLGMRSIAGAGRAFRHDLATGQTLDLGSLPGYARSRATAIDGAGRVLGFSTDAAPDRPFRAAWLWDETAGMTDLNSLVPAGAGWLLSDAFAINDAGWIAGQGAFMGQRRGYLLVPAPTA